MGAVRRKHRNSRGFSILEILLAAILSAAALAVLGELSVLLTIATITTWTKTEGLAAARFALARISSDVRHARGFGDTYAGSGSHLLFPASNNPIYGSTPPLGGWPPPPWKTMILSPTILIIQQPVFLSDPGVSLNGVPVMLPGATQNQENLTTVVYEVLPDPLKTDQYILQVARFPGKLTSYPVSDKAINPPQTILKGLIGPKPNPTQPPNVFTYLAQLDQTKPYYEVSPAADNVESIRGIAIDLEIRNTNLATSSEGERFPQTLAVHTEAFARSNNQLIFRNVR